MIHDDLTLLSVATSLSSMMRSRYFSITTLDHCATALGISIAEKQSYKNLHTLHCVDFADMPRELREKIPDLIKDCLGVIDAPTNPWDQPIRRIS